MSKQVEPLCYNETNFDKQSGSVDDLTQSEDKEATLKHINVDLDAFTFHTFSILIGKSATNIKIRFVI